MCSIYGAFGRTIDERIVEEIRSQARDRGRDGGRMERYETTDGYEAILGNWRATPTPEPESGLRQPYNQMVHNGTIANDQELGANPGEIDSQVLSRFLRRGHLDILVQSLRHVKGSYALACYNGHTVLAATNYKPLYYARLDGTTYFSSMARHFTHVLPFGHAPVPLKPYTAIDFRTRHMATLEHQNAKRAVVIASAGLDSTVAATKLVRDGWDVCLLHFAYGCHAESREHQAIFNIATFLNCRFHFMDIPMSKTIGGSALYNDPQHISGAIAGAEYAHEWVPARNLVFISLAIAWAEANGYHAVALGNNLEEAGAYPDNEEQFTTLLDAAVPYAVQAHYGMRVLSPVGQLMKHEIVKLGLELNAPLAHTWSCYRGGTVHCGECGPCFMRRMAFERNGASDPVFNVAV